MKKIMMNKVFTYFTVFALLGAFSCADLEIENFNDPDNTQVLSSANDVFNLPGGAFINWHQSTSTVNCGPALACNADVLTCSWGNFGIRNFSWEPPIPINNSLTSNDIAAIRTAYINLYSANSIAIDVERFVSNPANVPMVVGGNDVTKMVEATALFLEGVSHGYISILYNQGFIADAATDLGTLNGSAYAPYSEVAAFAVGKLEAAAAIADANTFTTPTNWINGLALTNVQFARLARTIAAQVLVYNARNATENAATNWAKVATLTAAGIQEDFAPIGDDNLWFDDFKLIGGGALVNGNVATTWSRVDQKVLNMIDPTYPDAYPATGTLGQLTSSDQRVTSDFLYNSAVFFPENRGRYRFSHYIHNRYAVTSTAWDGKPMVKIMKAENDLMRAEALIRSGGSKTTAADLINLTRVGRGGLPALTGSESNAEMLAAVRYEKIIELLNTWGGRELAEVRRWGDWLRTGAFEQLPVPGEELVLLGVPIYTFGGVE
jgi:starch-binding outer membrane protein, SusD/RagB family